MSGKLAEHRKSADELGFEMAEQIWVRYLEQYSISDESFIERIQVYQMAQSVADEVVMVLVMN